MIGLFIIKKRMMGLTYDMVLADQLGGGNRNEIGRLLSGEPSRVWNDSDLGWVMSPKGDFTHQQKDIERRVRVAAFGDSYTERSGLETLGSVNNRLEIVNFGVGGYGLDQTYLRYLKVAPTIDADVVLIGFMTENANRDLNVFRPFYFPIGGLAFSKPRFKLTNGELELLENPLPGLSDYRELLNNPKEMLRYLGKNDHYFSHRPESSTFDFSSTVRLVKLVIWGIKHKLLINAYIQNGIYNEQTEAYQIIKRILEKYHDEVLNNGSSPLIVLFPRKVDISRHRTEGTDVYQPLIEYFDNKGYKYIDLLDAFGKHDDALKVEDVFTPDGTHYNEKGNAVVREYILSYLAENYLDQASSTRE